MTTEQSAGAPLAGISSMAMAGVLAELADAWQQQAPQRVSIVSVGGVDALRRVRAGEAFDFAALAADALEQLGAEGHIDARSRTALARSRVALAVKAGAPHPDIANEAALERAVRAARSVGYSTGPSGVHLARLLARWGIDATTGPRLVQAPPGVPVGTLVAHGEVELGFQQSSELMHVPGIDVVGALPADCGAVTMFSAAVCTASRQPTAAATLLAFFASPPADAAKRRHGMEPAPQSGRDTAA